MLHTRHKSNQRKAKTEGSTSCPDECMRKQSAPECAHRPVFSGLPLWVTVGFFRLPVCRRWSGRPPWGVHTKWVRRVLAPALHQRQYWLEAWEYLCSQSSLESWQWARAWGIWLKAINNHCRKMLQCWWNVCELRRLSPRPTGRSASDPPRTTSLPGRSFNYVHSVAFCVFFKCTVLLSGDSGSAGGGARTSSGSCGN